MYTPGMVLVGLIVAPSNHARLTVPPHSIWEYGVCPAVVSSNPPEQE
jgi:hypothetical protein